jgi:amino acid permease
MRDDKDKKDKNIKLLTRQHIVVISVAVCIGVGLYIYCAVTEKGSFDITILLSALFTLIIIGAIIFALVWWANRPEKED